MVSMVMGCKNVEHTIRDALVISPSTLVLGDVPEHTTSRVPNQVYTIYYIYVLLLLEAVVHMHAMMTALLC